MSIKNKYSQIAFDDKICNLLKSIKKDNPVIIIQGGYGKFNTGDDALLEVIYQKIKDVLPNSRIIVLCHGPKVINQRYGFECYSFKSLNAQIMLFVADMLIIGGGGIVNKINTYSGYTVLKVFDLKGKYLFMTSILMKVRRKKVIFYGVGMNSIPDYLVRLLMKITIPIIDLIYVRDVQSYDTIKAFNVKKKIYLAHDPAIDLLAATDIDALTIMSNEGINNKKYKVGINLRYVINQDINKKLVQETAKFVDYINNNFSNYEIIYIPISKHPTKWVENDLMLGEEIYELLDNKCMNIIRGYYKPGETKAILKQMDYLIITRLHAAILSYEYEIPSAVIAYDDKVTEFMKMAERTKFIIKLEEYNFNLLKHRFLECIAKK